MYSRALATRLVSCAPSWRPGLRRESCAAQGGIHPWWSGGAPRRGTRSSESTQAVGELENNE